jgi:uncharacterized protein
MKETIKDSVERIILDFHEALVPIPSPRELKIVALPGKIRKAHVFIGMRRSGKTWAMYQCIHQLLAKGVEKHQIVYINFEDDRLLDFRAGDFQLLLDTYFSLYPKCADCKGVYFFFDEIQQVEGWEKFIRRLLDTTMAGIYISGSSSKMLSKEIATSLRGRTITYEIFPFNFREYLIYHKVKPAEKLSTAQTAQVSHWGDKFLLYGGFPESLALKLDFHRQLLQGYIDVVIYRDIAQRHSVANVEVLREFIAYCLQNISALISMNKVYARLKADNRNIGKDSLYEFINYLEDAYCLFAVPLYSFSANKRTMNPKKIYAIDQGFISAYTIKSEYEKAARLENAVFCALRHKNEKIFYYKTKSGKEVDFVQVMQDSTVELYQVCVTLSSQETRNREISALAQAMEELGIKHARIITTNEKEDIKINGLHIECVPFWQWVLKDG